MKTPESDAVYELQSKILKVAFKREKFEYPQSSEIIEVPTKLYIHSSDNRKISIPIGCRENMKVKLTKGVIRGLSTDMLIDIHDLFFKMDSFAYDLSEIIWHCKEERGPEWRRRVLSEIEQSYISKMEHFLKKNKHEKATLNIFLREEQKHAKKEVAKIRKTVDFN